MSLDELKLALWQLIQAGFVFRAHTRWAGQPFRLSIRHGDRDVGMVVNWEWSGLLLAAVETAREWPREKAA